MTGRSLFFTLFALSGFSGLIYESIWSHYLKLFLGHAAYAQTLVIAIYMGGMAAGSWLSSRYAPRRGNLLLAYALTEGVIGLCGVLFHPVFTHTVDFAYSSIIPHLPDGFPVTACKWGVGALLILPQSILLGMTFPLMSTGLLRRFPAQPGRGVALLYFSNSMGAALGVLASGFLLVRLLGLPGTIMVSGVLNILLALAVLLILKVSPGKEAICEGPGTQTVPVTGPAAWFLPAAFITGAASFMYEIGWIRMLSLVLGTSTHAFELMLSAFILGLAFGGLRLKSRIDSIASPVLCLAKVQVIMGLLALSTLLLYGRTFSIMQWLVLSLEKSDTGYTLFNLAGSAIALGIMLPTTFCAGMTLPLLTLLLLQGGYGERSIGAVYAANTVGAIAGVMFAIHVGMPLLGLKGLITCGAGLDILLGVALFWRSARSSRSYRLPALATAAGVCALAYVGGVVELDLVKMGSGVYRHGILLDGAHFRHLYHRDGKTATVDVFLDGLGNMRIATNGKTDATIMMDPERSAGKDETTMVLLGAIPMALKPDAEKAAVIGLGSGLTAQTLLTNPALRRVDTVEIEPAMVAGAESFRPRVEGVYRDPRSTIHREDAKTFFSSRGDRYDLIVSEPSNPWVSGVSGLFSTEFYRLIGRSLSHRGLFVQWVQLYEIDTRLVMSVLKGVAENFSDYAVYAPDDMDLLIVATREGRIGEPNSSIMANPALATALERIRIGGIQDLALRKIGDRRSFAGLLASSPIPANSDYFPVLDQDAARTRFLNSSAQELVEFADDYRPLLEELSGSAPSRETTAITPTADFPRSQRAFTAMALRDFLLSGVFPHRYDSVEEEDRAPAKRVRQMFHDCTPPTPGDGRLESLFVTGIAITPYLSRQELRQIWQALETGRCAPSLVPVEKELLSLFKAMGERDGARVAHSAKSVAIMVRGDLSPVAIRYLTAAEMLGQLLQGDRRSAHRAWEGNRQELFGPGEPDLLFRLLVAETTAPATGSGTVARRD